MSQQTPFSLLLLRRLSLSSKTFDYPKHHFNGFHLTVTKPFSTSNNPTPNPPTSLDPQAKPGSLSSRMSFILDQIYEIEKRKQESDQTLQKIRAWRQSKLQQQQQTHETLETVSAQKQEDPEIVSEVNENPEVVSGLQQNPESVSVEEKESVRKEVELVHPWPEWIEFMERLVKQNYFDHRRKDEDKMVKDLGFSDFVENVVDVGIDFNDFKTVQTACLNFGKDRFDILRFVD